MLAYLPDATFVLLMLAIAYVTSQRGMVHAAAYSIAVLIASLLSITTFESTANWVERTYLLASDWRIAVHLYFLVSIVVFGASLTGLLWCVNAILPDAPEMTRWVDKIGGWAFGGLAGYLFASFLLIAVQTFPAPRECWGLLAPEAHRRAGPITFTAPDYQLLALTEFTCDHDFALTGGAWLLDRPVISAEPEGGRWSSFPTRFATWRENHEWRWGGEFVDDEEEEEDEVDEEEEVVLYQTPRSASEASSPI